MENIIAMVKIAIFVLFLGFPYWELMFSRNFCSLRIGFLSNMLWDKIINGDYSMVHVESFCQAFMILSYHYFWMQANKSASKGWISDIEGTQFVMDSC